MKTEKKTTFVKSVSNVAIILIIGKILGFIKQIILASFYGTSKQTDLFFTSYFFITEISTAFFSAVGVVLLSAYAKIKKNDKKNTYKLISSTLIFFVILSFLISIILFCFPNIFVKLIAPGFDNTIKKELILYLRVLSPVAILFCIQSIFNSILEYEKKFIPTKTLTIILNSFIICFTFILSKRLGIIALILAVVIAFIVQTIISILFSKKYVSFKFLNPFKNYEFISMLRLYLPLFISNAILEINSIVDRSIASTLGSGSISAITYAASINEIVTVLLIGTIATIFYSYITSMINESSKEDIKNFIEKVIKVLLIILVPLNIIFVSCSSEIVEFLYMRGSFDMTSVKNTSIVVIGYAIGFIPLMIRTLLIKIHYAYDDTKTPMINGIITVLTNIIFSVILSINIGILGISIATTISFIISMVLSIVTVKKYIKINLRRDYFIFLFKLVVTSIVILFSVFLFKQFLSFSAIINLIIICLSIFLIYFIFLKILNIYNFKELKKILIKLVK